MFSFRKAGRIGMGSAEREGLKQRFKEMREFLEQQYTEVTEYDELLVRRLIEKVTVYDEWFLQI